MYCTDIEFFIISRNSLFIIVRDNSVGKCIHFLDIYQYTENTGNNFLFDLKLFPCIKIKESVMSDGCPLISKCPVSLSEWALSPTDVRRTSNPTPLDIKCMWSSVLSITAKPDLCRNIFIKEMLKFSAQKIPGNALLWHTIMKKYKVFN